MEAEQPTAAESLAGLDLDGGWQVVERQQRQVDATGGSFSVGYVVQNSGGSRAFLKALDFSSALEADDPAREMARLTAEYEFERATLQICKDRRLTRIAVPLAEGVVAVPGFKRAGRVNYLIFDLADGDARLHLSRSKPQDIAWRLRSLHHVATALQQLHANRTAHQDVKPSNILEYGPQGSKLTDLGRSARLGVSSPHDDCRIAGDLGYAPLELLYGEIDVDWARRRFGCDAYLLGGLIVYFFTGVSITTSVQLRLHESHRWQNWGGTYREVLPYVRSAFDETINAFEAELNKISKRLAGGLPVLVRQLADPDLILRGDPKNRGTVKSQYSLIRYVSHLNSLARKAELKLL